MYSIKINYKDKSHRYLLWCNDHWYGTQLHDLTKFTKEEVVRISGQLKNHYVYDFEVLDENGKVMFTSKPKTTQK